MDLSTNELNKVYDISQNHQLLFDERKNEYEKIMNERKKELVRVILRQTEYNENEAESKLKETDYNVIKVLNEYHGISNKVKVYPNTTNQQIYGEIRNLMDSSAKKFRDDQENAKKSQERIERQHKLERETQTIIEKVIE